MSLAQGNRCFGGWPTSPGRIGVAVPWLLPSMPGLPVVFGSEARLSAYFPSESVMKPRSPCSGTVPGPLKRCNKDQMSFPRHILFGGVQLTTANAQG